MLRKMSVEQFIERLSDYPKNLEVTVIADNELIPQEGIDMGISQDGEKLIIHAGNEQREALG